VGKLKRKNVLGIFWSLTGFVGLVLYAGCATDLGEHLQSGQVLPLHGLQGRWVGSVTPSESACGKATKGSLSIGPKGFGFDPFQSTLTIQGEVSEDGRLHGSTTRRGADHQELVLIFDGTATTPGVLDGALESGRCHWAVSLHRG
jgi:hypothetical protein